MAKRGIMKTKITNIIYLLFLFWLVFLMFVGISWGIGYYQNAFNHSKFYDLSSCMFGISTAASALGSILVLAVSNFFHEKERTKRYDYKIRAISERERQRTERYNIDSLHNSIPGQIPIETYPERRGSE